MIEYKRRIANAETYIWGGTKVAAPLNAQLVLLLHNDDAGEEIMFGQHKKQDGKLDLGLLEPGATYAVALDGLIGVYARCTTDKADSFVRCVVIVNK